MNDNNLNGNSSNRNNSKGKRSTKNEITNYLFVLPLRFLKPGISLNELLSEINTSTPFFNIELLKCQITATCVNIDNLGPQLSLGEISKLKNLSFPNTINKEILFLVLVSFSGSRGDLESFFSWWLFQLISPDYYSSISIKSKTTWLKRRLLQESRDVNVFQNLPQRCQDLLKEGILSGNSKGDPIFSSAFNLVWTFNGSKLEPHYSEYLQIASKFLSINSGGWKLEYPSRDPLDTFYTKDNKAFSLILSDYLFSNQINPIPDKNYHVERVSRCNFSPIEFVEISLKTVFRTPSILEKWCVILDTNRSVQPLPVNF